MRGDAEASIYERGVAARTTRGLQFSPAKIDAAHKIDAAPYSVPATCSFAGTEALTVIKR
jgi:hypothetical protein